MAKISFTIDASQDLTMVNAVGKITCQEFKDTITQYSREQQTVKVLWNLIQADALELTTEDFKSIHQHPLGLFANKPNRKIAVVVGRPVGFGLSRMSTAYGKMANPGNQYKTFYNVEEALEWLGSNQAGDGHSAGPKSRAAFGPGDVPRVL
jgi:ureidoglycolate hydrolase